MRILQWALCALLICWGAQSALADSPTPWTNPGGDPLRVSLEEVAKSHEATHGLLTAEEIVAAAESGRCTEDFLQDGDVLWTSFGAGKVELRQVAFGDKYPPDHEIRKADSCAVGPGKPLVINPHVCGNWSVKPPETVAQQCVRVETKTLVHEPAQSFSTSGILISGCCCNQTQWLSGATATIPSHTGTRTTWTTVCKPSTE